MKYLGQVSLLVCLLFFCAGQLVAAVTGDCVNCHTMHNSQDGAPVTDDGVANANLLTSDCVGCHSNTGSETIVPIGNSDVPIVFNSNGGLQYPADGSQNSALAGGNFYWVVENGDSYGHNVFGISVEDVQLPIFPGAPGTSIFTGNELCGDCHGSLATELSGCRGCHFPRHHLSGGVTPIADAEDGWYRFLGSAMDARLVSVETARGAPGVLGVEDPLWEQNPSSTVHNVYKGTTTLYQRSYYPVDNSIGSFCSGCHSNFHSGMVTLPSFTWIRHPSDVVLPADAGKDYAAYTTYNPIAPVAKQTLDGTVSADVVAGEDLVTCLSCHRAHGSPYPDMLRWDYVGECVAGSGTSADACGCFACHTTKDDL